jgi:hypothetical protein
MNGTGESACLPCSGEAIAIISNSFLGQDLRKSTLETPYLVGARSCAPLPDMAFVRKS